MFEASPTRRYKTKRLSYADSVRFLNNIKRYLPEDAHGRTLRLSEMLGCNRRTAQRLLNSNVAAVPRLRKTYIEQASAYTGDTMLALVNRLPECAEMRDRMHMLRDGIPKLDQFNEAAILAASMSARVMFGYDMPASFTVDSNAALEVMSLRVKFMHNDLPGYLHEVAIVKDEDHKWTMVYNHPECGSRFTGVPSDDNFDRILSFVKHTKKNGIYKKPSTRPAVV